MKPIVLKENSDFRRIYSRGKYAVGSNLITYCISTKKPRVRFGITSGKKIGNSVARNRCKRIIREAFREISPRIVHGCDLVFVARGKTSTVKTADVLRDMQHQLEVLGVVEVARKKS